MLLNHKVSCFVHRSSQPSLSPLFAVQKRKKDDRTRHKQEPERGRDAGVRHCPAQCPLFSQSHEDVFRKSHGSFCLTAKNTEGCDITILFFCQQHILSGSSKHWEDTANALSLFAREVDFNYRRGELELVVQSFFFNPLT